MELPHAQSRPSSCQFLEKERNCLPVGGVNISDGKHLQPDILIIESLEILL